MRSCRSGLHLVVQGVRTCPECKKVTNRRANEKYRVAGRHAEQQRVWYRHKYHGDPAFHERELARFRARFASPAEKLARHAGVSVGVARDMLDVGR